MRLPWAKNEKVEKIAFKLRVCSFRIVLVIETDKMKTENRHINFQEPEGMMLLRYIKDTASNEEKSYIEAWLEADEK